MKITPKKIAGFLIALSALLSARLAHSEVVYDNSRTDTGNTFNPGAHEVGDEIILGGTARSLTDRKSVV